MGGREAILTWDAATARSCEAEFQNRCHIKVENDLQQSFQNGKYNFLTTVIPFLDVPRPLDISLGDHSWSVFVQMAFVVTLLCSEVETGRYDRKPRVERFCTRCWKSVFLQVIGDEHHALTECARGESARNDFLSFLRVLQEQITSFQAPDKWKAIYRAAQLRNLGAIS